MEEQKRLSLKSASLERSLRLILVSMRLIRSTSKRVYNIFSLQCSQESFQALLFTFRLLTFDKCVLTALDHLIERLEPKVGINESDSRNKVILL